MSARRPAGSSPGRVRPGVRGEVAAALHRQEVETRIGRALLSGNVPDGSAIRVDVQHGEIVIDHAPPADPQGTPRAPPARPNHLAWWSARSAARRTGCRRPPVVGLGAATASPRCPGSSTPVTTASPRSPTSRAPVLVDLWAPWCGPCRMVSPVLQQLATEMAGRIKLVKVNSDVAPQVSQRSRCRRFRRWCCSTVAKSCPRSVRRPRLRCAAGWSRPLPEERPGDRRDASRYRPASGTRPGPWPRTPDGCEECLRIGSPWVHLRCARAAATWAAATRHRTAMPARTPSHCDIRSSSLSAGRGLAMVLHR